MSAGNAFPNFTAKTCKNVSMQMHQHPVQLWVEFVEKQQETPGSHQKRLCGYENQRETILRVRDNVLKVPLFTSHADIQKKNLTCEISVHSADRREESLWTPLPVLLLSSLSFSLLPLVS